MADPIPTLTDAEREGGRPMTDQPNVPLVLTLVANALLLLQGRADDDAVTS